MSKLTEFDLDHAETLLKAEGSFSYAIEDERRGLMYSAKVKLE